MKPNASGGMIVEHIMAMQNTIQEVLKKRTGTACRTYGDFDFNFRWPTSNLEDFRDHSLNRIGASFFYDDTNELFFLVLE